MLVGAGVAAGAAIAAVDNFGSRGEVSPIVVVLLLLAATAAFGFFWGLRGWAAAATAWLCVPSSHLLKHVLGLPDTLHPNTYVSILMLAAFSLVVSAAGIASGALLRRAVEA